MSTQYLFRERSYLRENGAEVIAIDSEGGIELDKTIFYAQSGGQPGDSGHIRTSSDQLIPIINCIHPSDKTRIFHLPADDARGLSVGDKVICEIDWDKRYNLMRMHTALHLLSVVLPYPVTGGSIGVDKGRLDFDMPEVPDNIVQLETDLNQRISEDLDVSDEWISDAEMAANPDMIKTMKVKPPMGQGHVRLIRIADGERVVDLQPCGGTHVAKTGEIGPVRIGKIQKKGKQNRRVYLHFA